MQPQRRTAKAGEHPALPGSARALGRLYPTRPGTEIAAALVRGVVRPGMRTRP
ncbi:hypothetical protein FA09DRAFT_327688 [Tilletiopsis washingtonensis]|uniref:Uncharacterized protein n=1 Tax=Tilletiopsis washingtonensis TaxID=58919 RepID=A0A316ZKR2_9BASI|nr:hypothetical protein FA09DRAFT_327688 [Tilletiopsis washingtonensis]PWO00976.1 hypothetical protein FA09DRAFT_327688 [Tilletiopsis washingtonensis]